MGAIRWRIGLVMALVIAFLSVAYMGFSPSETRAIDTQRARVVEKLAFERYLSRFERNAGEFDDPVIEKNSDGWIFSRSLKSNPNSAVTTWVFHNGQYDVIGMPKEDQAREEERWRRKTRGE